MLVAASQHAPASSSLLAALQRPRYEVLPLDGVAEDVIAHLPHGSKITVTASPTKGLEATLGVAEALAARDYSVVPHLSARLVRDRAHLEEIVARLRAVEVREVFVIAGDARQPAGEYTGAAELLAAMGELRESFAEIGISGYPESHHFISDETTIEAMFAKEPMATYIVSQICFDSDVIATWVQARPRPRHPPADLDRRARRRRHPQAHAHVAAHRARRVGPLPSRPARPAPPLPLAAPLHPHRSSRAAVPDLRRPRRPGWAASTCTPSTS